MAAVCDRNGRPSDARWFRYQGAVRARRRSGWLGGRIPGLIYGLTTGHGYYPLRSLVWLLLVMLCTFGLARAFQDSFIPDAAEGATVAKATSCNDSAGSATCFDALTYSIANTLPISTGVSQSWQPSPGWLSYTMQMLRVCGWILAGLMVAGLAGLLKRAN